jgi:hypothetical protein
MVSVPEQIKTNYESFSSVLPGQLASNFDVFKGNPKLIESYARIAALNALKVDLVEPIFSNGSAQFFFEAHNDALLSHVNASMGSWRPALQSLRSFLENTLAAVYYRDHPVEFTKWENGNFKMSPQALREYICEHPLIVDVGNELDLKANLDKEYATLSKAVHGSNSLFRMTNSDGKTNIATASLPDLSKWAARERETVNLGVVILVSIFKEQLDGAKLPSLRKALSIPLLSKSRSVLKSKLGITIKAP